MAKGFTVKAKNPKKTTPKKPEWDYNLARGLVKGKTIVYLNEVTAHVPLLIRKFRVMHKSADHFFGLLRPYSLCY